MKNRDYIIKRLPVLYSQKWESQGKTQQQFADAIRKIIPDSGINKTYVSRLLNGKYAPRPYLLQAICDVLEVDISEFEPKTHDDRYQYSSDYADGLEGRLEEIAEKNVNIDLTFFQGLRNIIPDFDSIYPCYFPLYYREADSNGEYYKRFVPADSSETSNGKGLFQLERDGQLYFLTKYDLKIIKTLQDAVIKSVCDWFVKVDREMKRAESAAIRKFIDKYGDSFVRDGLSSAELQELDPLGMYTDDERKKYNIPEGPIYSEGNKETEV